jgi:UDP-N-acetylmuramoyl-L-alanyl-D-glutamate--2,6-diaminopimelate ligase
VDGATNPAGGIPRPERVGAVSLSELGAIAGRLDGADAQVTGVSAASGRTRPGDLFAALPGAHTHGAQHAGAAVAAGAVAVLTDETGLAVVRSALPAGVPVIVAADVRTVLGPVSARVYGEPARRMQLLGVTGTSGKTTTTFFLRAALRAAGHRTGLIGTISTYLDDEAVATGFTTPEAPDVHALLAVMAERGLTHVVMEVSSHALALGRVGGIPYTVAGFTNLSQDHLDFHPDMESYFAAKASLFASTSAACVVTDDEWGARLAADLVHTPVPTTTVTTRTAGTASWWADDIVARPDGSTTFAACADAGHGDVCAPAATAIPGAYNVANALLALAMLDAVGVDVSAAATAISTATVPGRMERVDAGQPFLAVVDYSHKPAAVDGALQALRPLAPGRLVVVLGCGGDRDRAKRPRMGEIAARGADLLIVTDDNPRSEDPAEIRSAMLGGARSVPAQQRGEIVEIGDRATAIDTAVRVARPGDVVLIAGKGHEQGQEAHGVVQPFDDRVVLRGALTAVWR